MIKKAETIALFVHDLDRCTAFYRDTIALPYKGSDPGHAAFDLPDGLMLVLLTPQTRSLRSNRRLRARPTIPPGSNQARAGAQRRSQPRSAIGRVPSLPGWRTAPQAGGLMMRPSSSAPSR